MVEWMEIGIREVWSETVGREGEGISADVIVTTAKVVEGRCGGDINETKSRLGKKGEEKLGEAKAGASNVFGLDRGHICVWVVKE